MRECRPEEQGMGTGGVICLPLRRSRRGPSSERTRQPLDRCVGPRPSALFRVQSNASLRLRAAALGLAAVLLCFESGRTAAYGSTAESATISGRIVDDGSQGVSGVLVELTPVPAGGGRQKVVTGTDGAYSIKVPKGWAGMVRPKAAVCAVYSPESKSYTNVTADRPSQDYQVSYRTVLISGRVTDSSGKGIPGVTIGGLAAFTGTTYVTVVTGPDGSYRHRVLCGFSHPEVKPAKPNCVFTPVSRSYSGVTADLVNQNYQGSRQPP